MIFADSINIPYFGTGIYIVWNKYEHLY